VTKKVLFFGVRNKFCCVCYSAKKREKEPAPHHGFQNLNGLSTTMEADIIVDGFKHSLEMHGVICTKLIGKKNVHNIILFYNFLGVCIHDKFI